VTAPKKLLPQSLSATAPSRGSLKFSSQELLKGVQEGVSEADGRSKFKIRSESDV